MKYKLIKKNAYDLFTDIIEFVGANNRSVKLYIVFWITLLISSSLNTLDAHKMLPLNFISSYSLIISDVMTIVLLLFSVRDRFNVIRQKNIIEANWGRLFGSFNNMTKTITSTNDISKIVNFSLESICKITKFQNGMILLKEEQGFVVRAILGYKADELKNTTLRGMEQDVYFKRIIKEKGLVILKDIEMHNYGIDRSFKSFIIFPITYYEKNIGIIVLYDDIIEASNRTQYEIIYNFIGQVGIAVENARLFNQVEKMAITDGLTGVFNRTHFLKISEALMENYSNTHKVLSLIMLDIDYFKKINDTYGHLVGDKVLQQLVEMLKMELDEEDIIGRYGGEEFLILLKDTNLKIAFNIAEKLRIKVESMKVKINKDSFVKFTISIGVASTSEYIIKTSQLIEKADKALYISKENGRNQVSIVQNLM